VHVNAALELLPKLPGDRASAELKLALQTSLGNSLMSTGGFAAEGVARAFERARELCGLVGDSTQLVPSLLGQWAFHNFSGSLKTAEQIAKELLSIAGRVQDPAATLMSHTSLGITMTHSGQLQRALEHCTRAASVFIPAQRLPAFLAQARTGGHIWLAQVFALTGRFEPALRVSNETVEVARESG
jgi:predicted ATPase